MARMLQARACAAHFWLVYAQRPAGKKASPGSPYLLLSGPMASESSSSDDAPLDCLSAASSLAVSASAVALLASVWAPSSLFLSSLFAFSDSSRRSSVRRT